MARIAVSASLFVGALAGCAAEDDSSDICSKRDGQLAEQLNDLPILDARPESATPTKSGSGCDASNGQAYANRSYRSPLARTEIVAFYEAALVRDGWQARPNSAVPPGTTRAATGINCYFTKMDGQFVHFAIPSSGSESTNYILEVNGQGQDGWASSCTPE
ncbi:hypothetical protein [Actinoplanes awajinensis]|nr:hypothetical protein [Actinoplanes awajinensis]